MTAANSTDERLCPSRQVSDTAATSEPVSSPIADFTPAPRPVTFQECMAAKVRPQIERHKTLQECGRYFYELACEAEGRSPYGMDERQTRIKAATDWAGFQGK